MQKGSATSLNESSSCSKISKSGSSFDSNQSVAGSSNGDRDADFAFRNGESDVEILSNPSQSSIEILDYSSRKHSEDRRVSQQPSLDTIEDDIHRLQMTAHQLVNQQTSTQDLLALQDSFGIDDDTIQTKAHIDDEKKTILNHINLTESSSSGSVTDSICTAYEQTTQTSEPIAKQSESKQTTPEKLAPQKTDTSVISSMLGGKHFDFYFLLKFLNIFSLAGLFLSTNILMSRSQRIEAQKSQCDEFKFSYTNFDSVDHRLKLYLYQNLFEDANEHLKWLVKAKLLVGGQTQSDQIIQYNGIVIMSTTKFYVMQITGNEW